MGKRHFDMIVQIPMEEEYDEFASTFSPDENLSTDINLMYSVSAPSSLKVAVTLQDTKGRLSARRTCSSALDRFSCNLYICLGIAGGLSKDMALGDVCYTGNVIDVYDNSKITDYQGGGLDIDFDPEHYRTKAELTAAIGFVRTMPELRSLLDYWLEDQTEFATSVLRAPVPGRGGENEVISRPKSRNGYIVCGAVSESEAYKKKLRGITRSILCIETESGAVFDVCSQRLVEALAIRGVSDYADRLRGVLEGESANLVRRIAAKNAATFLHMQMQNPIFLTAFHSLSNVSPVPKIARGAADDYAPTVPDLLRRIGSETDRKLRELSPQYRTKPSGYRLPTPRVRPSQDTAIGDNRRRPPSQEVVTALTKHRRMIIHVPRTYPDPALSWVIANALQLAELQERKLIPVVVEGRDIGPPDATPFRRSPVDLIADVSDKGAEYVYIIDYPILSSKTRRVFLEKTIKADLESRYIILTRDDPAFLAELEFKREIGAETFGLCDVSFSEMAIFLEKSFEMPSAEAEVVALKLMETFSQFSLPAHPSFFAGIPPEMLYALLLANRRSELIQLAVDGR